ncbi:unnamed protein product [Musa acuminata subsp. burmannicoides]
MNKAQGSSQGCDIVGQQHMGSGRSLAREKMVVAHSTQALLLISDIARKMFDAAEKGGELPWQRPCHNSDGAKPGINDNPAMATSMSQHQQQSNHDNVRIGEGGKPGINDNPKKRERRGRSHFAQIPT